MPTLPEMVEAVERLLRERASQEEAKSFPIGTVRKWKDGNEYIKTPDGWVPHTKGQKQAATPAPSPAKPVAAIGASSRKTQHFKPEAAAKTFADFLTNPAAPENQKAVRETLNTLCRDFGMLDRDAGSVGAFKIESRSKEQLPGGAGGIHDWDGGIIVRDKSIKRAQDLVAAQAAGQAGNPKGAKGMHVLVHEAVHGHSPIRREQFKGRYRLLEEATTEMAARKVMKDAFGTGWDKFSAGPDSFGAYHLFCDSLQQGVQAALGRKGFKLDKADDWNSFIGEASVEMRRRPPPSDPDKNAYLRRFASSLPISEERLNQMGGADSVREEVAKSVWLSLKPAKEEEKLRMAEVKLIKLGLLDPKNPTKVPPEVLKEIEPYVKALAKAKQDWASYLAGGTVSESKLVALLAALREADLGLSEPLTDEDAGMLPRNDIDLAIAYARLLDRDGKLDGWALRDLAMLQDDVKGALVKLRDAVERYGLKVQGTDD